MMHRFVFILISLLCLLILVQCVQKGSTIKLDQSDTGQILLVDDEPFIINGMNWDYIPIGKNAVDARFWEMPDALIKKGLDRELKLLQDMRVNTLRIYTGMPPKWIRYIYEQYGVYTIINHAFGRYGLTIDNEWVEPTIYSDARVGQILLSEIDSIVNVYKDTPGLLMYLLGNENNYGLFWSGAETENIPKGPELDKVIAESRARPMYRLMNKAAQNIHALDPNHPVAICNGDLLFLDIINEECQDVDVFGTNVYRGLSFGNLFDEVKRVYGKPVLFTEFGADAYDAILQKEDQVAQAEFLKSNWQEIYSNVSGLRNAQNVIGGCTFQFSDGWWKYDFDNRKRADVQDNNASWSNGGYYHDYVEGQNNMNEEWFGICIKGPTDADGLYSLKPRKAYFTLKAIHAIDPYSPNISIEALGQRFNEIRIDK